MTAMKVNRQTMSNEDMLPNIIYILADDLGFGDLSCYGAKHFHTPHLDRLAQEGMRFRKAHTPSAVCTPTRYGVLTGRYCWRSKLKKGVLGGFSEPLIEKERVTVASYLRDKGYATACIGKWHLGLGWVKAGDEINYSAPINHGPTHLGFDEYFGISASLDMPPYCFIKNDRTVGIPELPKDPIDFSQAGRGGPMVHGWKDDEVNKVHTEQAVNFIERSIEEKDSKPFFMYLALTGPHTPWTPSPSFVGKSGIGLRGDMILEMDWTVGQVMQALEKQGVRDNTLIMFTSDNGPDPFTDEITVYGHTPAGPLRGQKSDIWDGGHRVPFIVSWPAKIKPGSVHDELICLTDLLATCAEINGEELLGNVGEDSISMLPVLMGGASLRESAVHHSLHGMFSVRRGKWKYIEGAGSGGFDRPKCIDQVIGLPYKDREQMTDEPKGQLYDMEEDISESNNLYSSRPDIVKMIAEELDLIKA